MNVNNNTVSIYSSDLDLNPRLLLKHFFKYIGFYVEENSKFLNNKNNYVNIINNNSLKEEKNIFCK